MATTFISREISRDALVTLFTADGSWQKVFGYFPTENDIKGQDPFLVIISAGTDQDMNSISMNPTKYMFAFTSFILMDDSDSGGTWTNQNTEDKLDELDKKFRQIVRDNPTVGSNPSALLKFADGQSQTDTITLYGVLYRTEMWILTAALPSGGA